jgi:hypothetical protein
VTFMRVTRDQRGYETTFLLHSPRPGERPRVLYWYRTAPGVRVGRRALDEEAIRAIEEQYPDIDFDWPQLLEEAESVPPEVERRPERPRRKLQRPPDQEPGAPPAAEARPSAQRASTPPRRDVEPAASSAPAPPGIPGAPAAPSASARREAEGGGPGNPLLDQLVGREIASRLRARYAEVSSRLLQLPPSAERDQWQQRADALDPDQWSTPEAILHGVEHADRLFDELKREM